MASRKDILLRAAWDILKKSDEGVYVESALEMSAFYDGTDCDGFCLMEDIATELGLDEDTEPLKEKETK